MDKKSFLLEIGSEEIPVSYVEPAMKQLADDIAAWLAGERLEHGEIRGFATPRRIALLVAGLALKQEDREEEVTGPPKAAAYRDGEPTKAALGFAKGQGIELDDLYTVETPKGEYLAAHVRTPGRATAEILAAGLAARIQALRFPKTMTWGDGSLRFARPIRWVVALLGDEVVEFPLGTLTASRTSRGHRLLGPEEVSIPSADDYETVLAGANVTADPRKRESAAKELARAEAKRMGGRLVEDDELVATVNYLVEKPAVLSGRFDEGFLELPREVITTAMKSHQRYFSVEDADGKLLPGFIVILNGERTRPDVVATGNERVLEARLQDARFYWREDAKLGLDGMMERLKSVKWLEGYGSIADRVERIVALARAVGGMILDGTPDSKLIPNMHELEPAARFCKADLASEMVKDGKEFTKLQGYMGQEYARVEGWSETRSAIIHEHYFPRFAGDRLPESAEATVLALADRLDAIVGFWLAGFAPTGSKDPYALRRQALAVLRILIEKELPLGLGRLVMKAIEGCRDQGLAVEDNTQYALRKFFLDRLKVMLGGEGIAPDIVDAVLATWDDSVLHLKARAVSLNALRGDEAFEKLVIGARRVANILAKEDWRASEAAAVGGDLAGWLGSWEIAGASVSELLIEEGAERDLFETMTATAAALKKDDDARDFASAYRRLADLGGAIDRYFDDVMVNVEDQTLRANRLVFLKCLALNFLHFADFSRVVLEGERED